MMESIKFKLIHEIHISDTEKIKKFLILKKGNKIFDDIITDKVFKKDDFIKYHVELSDGKLNKDDFIEENILFICNGGICRKDIKLDDVKSKEFVVNVYSRNKEFVPKIKELYLLKGENDKKIIYNSLSTINHKSTSDDCKIDDDCKKSIEDTVVEIDDDAYIKEANEDFIKDFSDPDLVILCNIINNKIDLLNKANQYFSSGNIEDDSKNINYNDLDFSNFSYSHELNCILSNISKMNINIEENKIKYYLDKTKGHLNLTLRQLLYDNLNEKEC
jgi:hypothetical protein